MTVPERKEIVEWLKSVSATLHDNHSQDERFKYYYNQIDEFVSYLASMVECGFLTGKF